MTVGEFKGLVAGFMGRSPEDFIVNGVDLLLGSMNMARLFIERSRNLTLSNTRVVFPKLHLTSGCHIGTAVSLETGESVSVKQIDRAFLPYNNSEGYFPIEVVSRDAHIMRTRRRVRMAGENHPDAREVSALPTATFSLVWHGQNVYIAPGNSDYFGGVQEIEVQADVVRFLKPYSEPMQEDFLLSYCTDFMLLKTLSLLNFHLKEDERVVLTGTELRHAWETLVSWDANMIYNSVDETSLD